MPRRRGAKPPVAAASGKDREEKVVSAAFSAGATSSPQSANTTQNQASGPVRIVISLDGTVTVLNSRCSNNSSQQPHSQSSLPSSFSPSSFRNNNNNDDDDDVDNEGDDSNRSHPFLVCCVVNCVNNVRVMVDPAKDAETTWDRMPEISAPGCLRSSFSASDVATEVDANNDDTGAEPVSRLHYNPARYTHIAAASPLEPIHPALGDMASRFNRKYEIACLLTAPTMYNNNSSSSVHQQPTAKPINNKHYAGLLRLVFSQDPRVALSDEEYARNSQQGGESEETIVNSNHNSNHHRQYHLAEGESDEERLSTAALTSSNDNSPVHASSGGGGGGAAGFSAAASTTVATLSVKSITSSSAPSSLASSSGDTTPAQLIVPPNRSYQVPSSAPFLGSSFLDHSAGGFAGSFATVNILGRSHHENHHPDNSDVVAANNRDQQRQQQQQQHQEYEILHRLGPVQFLPPVESALFVHRLPTAVQLLIAEVPDPELDACEVFLARAVRDILECDEYAGSHPSSHIQNFVQYMPSYEHVIGTAATAASASSSNAVHGSSSAAHNNTTAATATASAAATAAAGGSTSSSHSNSIHRCWNSFIDAHSGREWCLFRYSQSMIDAMQLGPATSGAGIKAGEPRLVAWRHLDNFLEADLAREQLRRSSETQVRERLLAEVAKRPLTQTQVMKMLAKDREFLSMMSPQLVKMLNVIEQDARYVVLRNNKLHPITVERNRDVAVSIALQRGAVASSSNKAGDDHNDGAGDADGEGDEDEEDDDNDDDDK